MKAVAWVLHRQGEPMALEERELQPGPGEALIRVAGCGICHTDLGFFYDGVPTRHPLPLTLGHEISGTVVAAGDGAASWVGRHVVVPAVMPCGSCSACRAGHGSICPRQVFPGNDVDGGFASHVVVPSRGLCPVPEGHDLAALCVIADAVSTPYQAIARSGLAEGDLAVFVGAGGVGGFGVQIAGALGATVVAIDTDDERLDRIATHGATLTISASREFKDIRQEIRSIARQREIPTWRQRIFETSGTPKGQALAFGLLSQGGYLGVVGYASEKVEIRLSNLMALDATAQGTWGCPPELYPAVLELVLQGRVSLDPFVEKRPLSTIGDAFGQIRAHRVSRRIILIPET